MQMENLLSRKEAAAFLNLSVRTLEAWAVRGEGPRMIKVGKKACYQPETLNAWIASRERAHTHDTGSLQSSK